jgi:hypothetical protein
MDAQAMMALRLADHELIPLICSTSAWIAFGALIGILHLLMLKWSVSRLVDGQSFVLAFAIQLVRFALIAAALAIVTCYFGALPLLVATAGILAVRTVIVRLGAQF